VLLIHDAAAIGPSWNVRATSADARITRMPSKSESPDAQSEESQSQYVTQLRTIEALGRCSQLQPRSGDLPPGPGCSCWLSFTVIPPPCSEKARISAVNAGPLGVFSRAYQQGQRQLRSGGELH
jgi:hypothetical protein